MLIVALKDLCPLQVKAEKGSLNLARLQQASRGVTQATAGVMAATKSGKCQIDETGEMGGGRGGGGGRVRGRAPLHAREDIAEHSIYST